MGFLVSLENEVEVCILYWESVGRYRCEGFLSLILCHLFFRVLWVCLSFGGISELAPVLYLVS